MDYIVAMINVTLPPLQGIKSLEQKLYEFCLEKDLMISDVQSESRKEHLVQARAEFAQRMKGLHTQEELGDVLNRDPSTIHHYLSS